MLEARAIQKSYGNLNVLRGVDLQLSPGEIVTLVGSSGAGKSTLLQIMGTLDTPDSGQVIFEGQDISKLSDRKQAAFRNRNLGFVFQFHHLLPEFTAIENVCIPAFVAGTSQNEAKKRAEELLELLQLSDRIQHKPSELSGGEQQRVAVARALINRPSYILADEPTGNLDSANSQHLYELIRNLSVQFGVAFLVTTHNETLAESGTRRMRMKDGMLISA